MAAISTPTFVDLESMRSLLECPICFEIPRDAVMLHCKNGHNVCSACKFQLDTNKAKCPQGQCDYDSPPGRNRTVADFIDKYPFEFPCKFAKTDDAGCGYKGTKDMLKCHETICEHRPVPCPRDSCKEYVTANGLIKHYEEAHKEKIYGKSTDPAFIEQWYLWESNDIRSFAWFESPVETSAGYVLPFAELWNGQVYLWLQMIAHSSVTRKLKCQITVGKAEFPTIYTAPVYPIDWIRERIINDEDCVRLNARDIQKMLTKDITEQQKRAGYSSKFKVAFKIVQRTVVQNVKN